MKVVFIAKTNLNTDGRILNEIKILQNYYGDNLEIDFILLPDRPLTIDLGNNVRVHAINTRFRNNKFLRFLTVLEFTLKTLTLLFKLRPKLIHAEDTAVVLPVYLYKLLKRNKVKVIYDDHEIPNKNESLEGKFFNHLEVKLMKKSDFIIFANEERMDILKAQHKLKTKLDYFLNLPYFEDVATSPMSKSTESIMNTLIDFHKNGYKIIMHQGSLEKERGREKLSDFSRIIPPDIKILIIGVTKKIFSDFIKQYNLNESNFIFGGYIEYQYLDKIWKLVDACIVMYLPTFINNRLCAPNRFYIAVNNQIPVLVNRDNPVLHNFIEKYKAGFFIEDIKDKDDLSKVINYSYSPNLMKDLIEEESKKLICIYKSIQQTK